MNTFPTLETSRLFLIPLKINDLEKMFDLYADSNVSKSMEHFNETVDFSTYKKNFTEWVAGGEIFTIRDKETMQFMGYIFSHQYIKQAKVSYSQIGAALKPDYWKKGYGTEAAKKLLEFVFINIDTPWICANQFQDNFVAEKVLQKCGLSFYKTYKLKNRLYNQYRYMRTDYLKNMNINDLQKDKFIYKLPEILKSPYNSKNPIRKIDYINYIKQPTEYLCGQAVVAMLADVSVEEIIFVMQNDKGTATAEIRNALKYYGLKTVTNARLKYTDETRLPECCILSLKLPEYGHWSLYYKGKYYDPEFGVSDKLPENAILKYYWEIIN